MFRQVTQHSGSVSSLLGPEATKKPPSLHQQSLTLLPQPARESDRLETRRVQQGWTCYRKTMIGARAGRCWAGADSLGCTGVWGLILSSWGLFGCEESRQQSSLQEQTPEAEPTAVGSADGADTGGEQPVEPGVDASEPARMGSDAPTMTDGTEPPSLEAEPEVVLEPTSDAAPSAPNTNAQTDAGSRVSTMADAAAAPSETPDAAQSDADEPGPVPDVSLTRAAVVLGACFPDDGVNRNLSNLWVQDLLAERWRLPAECLSTAGDGCGALTTCLGISYESSTLECPFECAAGILHGCTGALEVTYDCNIRERECDEQFGCVVPGTARCEEGSAGSCSDDGRPLLCNDGLLDVGPSCEDFGLACGEGRCRADGESCPSRSGLLESTLEFDGVGCDGPVMISCIGGQLGSVDCRSRGPGFTCQQLDDVYFCGLANECIPGNTPGAEQPGTGFGCDGTSVRFCNAGRLEMIDCTELGFDGCSEEFDGCVPNFQSMLAQP